MKKKFGLEKNSNFKTALSQIVNGNNHIEKNEPLSISIDTKQLDEKPIKRPENNVHEIVDKKDSVSTVNCDKIEYAKSTISNGVELTGDLSCQGDVDIHGIVKGNVTADGHVHVLGTIKGNVSANSIVFEKGNIEGEKIIIKTNVEIKDYSKVKADIQAENIIINGCVDGDLVASEKITLHKSAQINGNINCKFIIIEDGAAIIGTLNTNRSI